MPDIDEDYRRIALEVSKHIPGLRVPIEEIYCVYVRKCPHIVGRLTVSGLPEHIRSYAEIKELQRIRAERKVRTKRRRKRPHQEPDSLFTEQNDTFFFIAGYTPGGAPYGVTWEQMGLEPWEEIE